MTSYRKRRLELTGQRFSKLRVIAFSHISKAARSMWRCKCDCGKEKDILGTNLARGHSQSCGCGCVDGLRVSPNRKPRLELTGKKFGKLQVLAFSYMSKSGRSIWRCRCACGQEKDVPGSNLVRGCSRSCGCAGAARWFVHGFGREQLRRLWVSLKYRCEDPAAPMYWFYGARGIKLCVEWQDYTRFREWSLQNGFKEGSILGRIDTAGNYEPNNCRWMAKSENPRLAHMGRKYRK